MKKSSVKLFIISAIALLLLLGAGAAWWYFNGGSAGAAAAVVTATPTRGDIEQLVTSQGKLEPRDYIDVGAQVSGRIEKLHIDIGDQVKAGDLIAEIDPKVYEAQVQADEARLKTLAAQLTQQRASAELARLQHERNEKLIADKAISQDAFENTATAYEVAKAQVVALEAQIEEANSTLEGNRANLGYTKIYAPMDGTVVSQSTKEGQTINASQTAPVIVQLANLDVMTVRAQVAEADVMSIKPDMDVYFTTLGSGERRWTAKVRQVLPTPESINDVVLYNVLVDVENYDRSLMTGMTTQMFFVVGRAEDALLIPSSLLIRKVPGSANDYKIKVQQGKDNIEKTVSIGLNDRTSAEVVAGLSEKDKIILPAPSLKADDDRPAAGGRGMRGMGRL